MEREGTPDSLHHIPNGEPEPTVMAEQLQVSTIMITGKPVFKVSGQVRINPVCTAIEITRVLK